MSADGILQHQKGRIPVLFIEPLSGSLEKLHDELVENDELQVVRCVSTLQALPILRQAGGGFLVMSVVDRNSVVKQVSLLKMLARFIRRGTVKVLVTSKIKHGGLFSLYQNHGVTELLEEPVHPRSLQIKAERTINRLRAMHKSGEPKSEAAAKEKNKRRRTAAGSKPAGPESTRAQEANWKVGPPLELESDFWLTRGGNGRRVMGRWMVRLLGPSPTVGRWLEIEGESSGTNRFWQWTPNNPDDSTFLKEEGAWVFYGHRPDFAEDRWVFVGSAPRLSFYYDGQSYGDKLITGEGGTLIIASDSKSAERMLQEILKTFERVIRAEQRKELEGDFRVEGEGGFDAGPEEVVDDEAESPVGWSGEVEGEEISDAGSEDYVDERDDAGGELNDLREDDEPAAEWNDERGENDGGEPAEWDDERGEDDAEESPELRAERDAAEGTELEGEFSEEQVISLAKRRGRKASGEDGGYDGEEDAEGAGSTGSFGGRKKRRSRDGEPDDSGEGKGGSSDGERAASKPGASSGGSPKVRAAEPSRPQYRVPAAEFGDAGGDWDFVRELENGNRCHVFVDAELSAGNIDDAASLEMYWLFESTDAPEWDDGTAEWVFWDRAPRVEGSFDGLPKAVQAYLRELEPDDQERQWLGELSEEGEIEADDSGDAEASGAGRKRKSRDNPPEEDEDDDSDVRVVEIVRDPEPKAARKRKDGAADENLYESDGAGSEEEEGSEDGAAAGFAMAMRKRIESLGDSIPTGVAEALEAVEESIQKSGMAAALELSKGGKSRKAKEGDLRGTPDEPGLSAMAMAFLLSELLGRVGMDPRWAAERFCVYLSNSLGGLRAELWRTAESGGWERVGAGGLGGESDPAPELIRETQGAVEGVPGVRRLSPLASSADVSGGRARLLLIGSDADRIPAEYLATLAHVLTGLAVALAATERATAAAA